MIERAHVFLASTLFRFLALTSCMATECQLHLLHNAFDIVIRDGDQSGGKGNVLIEAPRWQNGCRLPMDEFENLDLNQSRQSQVKPGLRSVGVRLISDASLILYNYIFQNNNILKIIINQNASTTLEKN